MRLKPYNWFYNRHKMDTAVVLLNGPSLGMVPLDWMSRYITFGGNKIYETYSPSYYVNNGSTHFSDSLSVEKIMVMMSREDHLASFLNRLAIQVFPHTKAYSIISSDAYPDYTPEQAYGFSFDPLVTIGVKGSVLYPMLQIIYYMGFKKVRLLGFDYNYVEGNPHFYPEDELDREDPPPGKYYDHDNEKWRAINDVILEACRDIYEEDGREIVNWTQDSMCDVFRREDPPWQG